MKSKLSRQRTSSLAQQSNTSLLRSSQLRILSRLASSLLQLFEVLSASTNRSYYGSSTTIFAFPFLLSWAPSFFFSFSAFSFTFFFFSAGCLDKAFLFLGDFLVGTGAASSSCSLWNSSFSSSIPYVLLAPLGSSTLSKPINIRSFSDRVHTNSSTTCRVSGEKVGASSSFLSSSSASSFTTGCSFVRISSSGVTRSSSTMGSGGSFTLAGFCLLFAGLFFFGEECWVLCLKLVVVRVETYE
ncbi:uncharacterized protein LOC111016884 [Momordica charantia]|uniref:Uncharacterized protein LOC111016884 n=1 Tax=Momordica charantia TaxID=3673 RepID=A0A6J1D229_MOMCH|nr:uncharacterized protein LOC111016884 [Momordica charantia]